MDPINVGIIGSGHRGVSNLAQCMTELTEEVDMRVTALCDIRPDRVKESQAYLQLRFGERGVDLEIEGTGDPQALIDRRDVDLVLVTTPQCAHKDPAVAALESGKKVYLDKPIAHTLEDAIAIAEAERRTRNPMVLGFTRRYETSWLKAYDLLQSGVIGQLHMVQIRDIIPFHNFFHRWTRRREWSGDAVNDKSSHHMDVFNWFTGSRAEKITGFGGRRVYLPKEDFPERCLECDLDCPYRVDPTRDRKVSQEGRSVTGDSWVNAADDYSRADTCVYKPGADILDHAVVQVAYENGVVASLFLSFFGPRAEDQETLELVGTRGRILLTRHTGMIDIVSDYGERHEVIDCKHETFGSTHFGADLELVRQLRRFCDGAPPRVSARHGCEATRMIVAALKSIDSGGEMVHMAELADAAL